MATAKERYQIALNVLARTGLNGDFLGEYSKAISTLNGFQTMQDMQNTPMTPPEAPNNPDMGLNQPPDGTISPPMDGSTPTEQTMPPQ